MGHMGEIELMQRAATADKQRAAARARPKEEDTSQRITTLEKTVSRLIGERDSAEGALRREKEISRMLREENERLRAVGLAKAIDPR